MKTLEVPVDPYMRGRMRDPRIKSYASAFVVGQRCVRHIFLCHSKLMRFTESSISGYGIGVVLRSEYPGVKTGGLISGMMGQRISFLFFILESRFNRFIGYQNYNICKNMDWLAKFENPHQLPLSTFIGVLGMPGMFLTHFIPFKKTQFLNR